MHGITSTFKECVRPGMFRLLHGSVVMARNNLPRVGAHKLYKYRKLSKCAGSAGRVVIKIRLENYFFDNYATFRSSYVITLCF